MKQGIKTIISEVLIVSKDNVRMIDEYEVINSIHIGDKELVLGENMNNVNGQYYKTCEVERNELFEFYNNALSSSDFTEIAGIYADRLKEQISKTALEIKAENAPLEVITAEKCNIDNFAVNMEGKIIVINPKILRAEYRTASHQIMKCTGGNGARANAIGSAVFGDLMINGKQKRYDRCDILGELKPEHYPDWLKDKIKLYDLIESTPNSFEYNGIHFVPIGVVNESFTKCSKNIESDMELGMWNVNYKGHNKLCKRNYNRMDFYEACGNLKCDVFKCLENGKFYMPGDKEMFLYKGKFKDYDTNKVKAKKHEEVER